VERVNVESSLIKSIGYQEETSVLEVEFNNGSVYLYAGVPEDIYDQILEADSAGKAFNNLVKTNGAYPYQRV
tara:strand:+ start:869 stop:1084 length:216 start_codon:yes stop_codon:yes gene_type:complete